MFSVSLRRHEPWKTWKKCARSFSLKDLIVTLEQQESKVVSSGAKATNPASVVTGPRSKASKFVVNTDTKLRPSFRQDRDTSSKLGSSVRESFRNASQKGSLGSPMGDSSSSSSESRGPSRFQGSGRNESPRQHSEGKGSWSRPSVRPGPSLPASSVGNLDTDGDMLSGEDRYARHQRNLNIKSAKFFRDVPSNEERVRFSGQGGAGAASRAPSAYTHHNRRNNAIDDLMEEKLQRNHEKKRTPAQAAVPAVVKVIKIPTHGYVTVEAVATAVGSKRGTIEKALKQLGEYPDNYSTDDSLFMEEAGLAGDGTLEVSLLSSMDNALNNGFTNKIDVDVAELVILELNRDDINVVREKSATSGRDILSASRYYSSSANSESDAVTDDKLLPRAPIVTIMGHVDHGKTTLMDSLRKGNVAGGEAGGITQKLSAFTVPTRKGGNAATDNIVFLDTPGHAAFQSMRACGASTTDVVVLVIAIEDGVRPQTIEAAKTAVDGGCSVIVALNKIDKVPDLQERNHLKQAIYAKLSELDILVEDYGGSVPVVEISAKTNEGVDSLVEMVQLQADLLDLKAADSGFAETTVLDARLEKGRGIIADVLVRWGRLSVGDNFVAGESFGRVKVMEDSFGRRIQSAGPASPIKLMGFRSIPIAGSELLSVASEENARHIAERRIRTTELRKAHESSLIHKASLAAAESAKAELVAENLANGIVEIARKRRQRTSQSSSNIAAATAAAALITKLPTVDLILKADGTGTLQALQLLVDDLAKKVVDIVDLRVIRASIGDLTSSDVNLASTIDAAAVARSKENAELQTQLSATVLGFNVNIIDSQTRSLLKHQDVEFVRDSVIYRLEDHVISMIEKYMPRERIETVEVTIGLYPHSALLVVFDCLPVFASRYRELPKSYKFSSTVTKITPL
jgi:small GTP-binding protein